jgi:hypothetical protein
LARGGGREAGLTVHPGVKDDLSDGQIRKIVKQYPDQKQVDLCVEIEVPGSWFGGTEMGSLNATERSAKYKAQAVEYDDVREFRPYAKVAQDQGEGHPLPMHRGPLCRGPECSLSLDEAVATGFVRTSRRLSPST